jgi:hypothetical protein
MRRGRLAYVCCARSETFWIDLCIDAFFCVDVVMNARTSFYDSNGFRENRPNKIFMSYLKG